MTGSEGGFMLIEVLISAMLVGLIGVGVFTGLAGANHATINERRNSQATVIAQQDEERLRGLPVAELTNYYKPTTQTVAENGMCVEGSTGAWKYSSAAATTACEALTAPFKGATYTGAVFTVESSAQFVDAAKEALTCETVNGKANDIETTSSVTWPSIGTHAPISQSSIVAVPLEGTMLIKVLNRNNEAVPGATVEAFDPATATTRTATATTPASGCVVFGDLTPGTARAVASKGEWIGKNGKTEPESPSLTVSTTAQAEATLTLEEPGGIEAKFVNSSTGTPVESSTFVAFQNEMSSPKFAVGGQANILGASAVLKNLFPFVTQGHPFTPNKYTVYAGDCEANNPITVGVSPVKSESAQVEPYRVSSASPASVEVAPVNVKVYQGTTASSSELASSTSAKIYNTACKGVKANNGETVKYEHEVKITNGELGTKYEYQPYASSLELCVVGENVKTKRYYKATIPSFANKLKAGTATQTLFLGSGTTAEPTTKC